TTCMRKGAVVNELTFELVDGQKVAVEVRSALNGGYAGRSQDDVAAHVAEMAALGVPAPTTTTYIYPVTPYPVSHANTLPAEHTLTSGEAVWAMIVTEDDVLLTVACDHTDRDLEVHGVAWSKQAGPDVVGRQAWRLSDVADRLDSLTLTGWV